MGLFNWRKKPAPVRERRLSYQVANLQGRGTRERQEDSFAFANALDVTEILRRGLLAVVADGMGGLKDGREVSQACVAQVLSAFSDLDPEEDLAGQLRTWVDRANDALYDRFQGEGGTTLVACLFLREQLWWLSVGDSYLYLLREGGLCRLNRDHNHLERLRLEAVRESDAILREEFANAGLEGKVWQYFTAIPDLRSVGVRENKRADEWCVIIRAVNTVDAMTATVENVPFDLLQHITARITSEVKGVNRVLFDLTPKPTGTIEWE